MAFCAKKSLITFPHHTIVIPRCIRNFSRNKFSFCLTALKNSKCYLASSGSTIYHCIHKTVPHLRTFDHVTILHQLICSSQIFFSTIFSKLIRNLFSHGTKGKILSYLDSFSRVIFEFDPMIFLQTFFSQCKQ